MIKYNIIICLLCLCLLLSIQNANGWDFSFKSEEKLSFINSQEVIYEGVPVKIALNKSSAPKDRVKYKSKILTILPRREIYVWVDDKFWEIGTIKRVCLKIANDYPDPRKLTIQLSNSQEYINESVQGSSRPWKFQTDNQNYRYNPFAFQNAIKNLKTAWLFRSENTEYIYSDDKEYREKIK